MTRRRLFVGAGCVLLPLVCLAAAWFIIVPTEVRAYYGIREGMTLSEVEAVIGLPPGDYRSSKQDAIWALPADSLALEADVRYWLWNNHEIWVAVGADGKTVGKMLRHSSGKNFIDRVLTFLGI